MTVAESRSVVGDAGARVHDVLPALVGARSGDRAGPRQVGGQEDPVPRQGVLDAYSPGLAGRRPSVHGDVASGVDHRRRRPGRLDDGQGSLRGPAFDEPRRVHAARQGPRVEPAVRSFACATAELEDLGHLRRRVLHADLAAPQPADRALRLPGAEHVVHPAELGLGARDRVVDAPACLTLLLLGGAGVSRRVPRALLPEAERDHRSHYLLLPVAHCPLPSVG